MTVTLMISFSSLVLLFWKSRIPNWRCSQHCPWTRHRGAADPPEWDHVAQFGGQAAELIGRQVQVDQVGQLGDVRRDAGQVVVVDVQRRQVSERPQRAAQTPHPPWVQTHTHTHSSGLHTLTSIESWCEYWLVFVLWWMLVSIDATVIQDFCFYAKTKRHKFSFQPDLNCCHCEKTTIQTRLVKVTFLHQGWMTVTYYSTWRNYKRNPVLIIHLINPREFNH